MAIEYSNADDAIRLPAVLGSLVYSRYRGLISHLPWFHYLLADRKINLFASWVSQASAVWV